jgi:hypothetical protein
MKARVKINTARFSTIRIYLPKEISRYIKTDSVVVSEKDSNIVIRESTIDDNKTLNFNERKLDYLVNYTSRNALDFLGELNIDIENEKLILYRDDEQ